MPTITSESIIVDSAGTWLARHARRPDVCTASVAVQFLSLARKFERSDFDRFDYIVVMDDDNYRNVRKLARTEEDVAKIHRMIDYSKKYSHHQKVPDPYYGGSSGFELVMDLLEDACENLLEEIKSCLM